MPIFQYLSYLKILKEDIKNHRNQYGYKARLAEAAGCQRSFLSQVLNEAAHFSTEQALRLACFWKFNPAETEYFLDLVQWARAGDAGLKQFYSERLERQRKASESLVNRVQTDRIMAEHDAAIYYSTWHYVAIHMLTTIPAYQTLPALAQRLSLSEEAVRPILGQLEKLGLVTRDARGWVSSQLTTHVPKTSMFNVMNHSHWRQKALEDSFLPLAAGIHYTSVCTLSLEDFEKMKQMVLSWIDDSRRLVKDSKEEELACFTCDWFKV